MSREPVEPASRGSVATMAPRLRRSLSIRLRASALVAVVTVGLSGCTLPRFGIPDPADKQGRPIASLWSGFFVAAIAVMLLVWVLLAFVLVKYRHRERPDGEVPSQKPYNIPLEITYTAIPVLIVAVLFFFSVRAQHQATAVSTKPAVRVEVIGFQWSWRFRYLGEGFTVDAKPGEPPELVLPLGAPTNLQLVSADVNHSFFVPRFLSKRDLIPGVHNVITVTPEKLGSYVGRCAEFCGLDHWRMYFSVKVVPMAQFKSWLAAHQGTGG